MSRLDHDLERDLPVIAEHVTPSPDSWASIRRRLADREPITETEIIMLTDNTLSTRRWPLVAAAAALVVVAIGAIIVIGAGGDDTEQPADIPPPTVAPESEMPDAVDEPAPEALPDVQRVLEGTTYQIDSLGVPITFTAPAPGGDPWQVQVADDVAVTVGPTFRFVSLQRIGSFYGADEALDPEMVGLGSVPADDVDGWIERNGIVVDERDETTVAGYPARFRQVRAPADAGDALCEGVFTDPPCISMSSASADLQTTGAGRASGLFGEHPHFIWIVELGDFEPLLIWAHSVEGDDNWLDEVTPFVESLTIGEPAPAIEGGAARLPMRVQVFASYSGTRAVEPALEDGPRAVVTTYTVEGDLAGELTGVGVQQTPAQGYDDLTFVGTIEGLGTGTLLMRQEWTSSLIAGISTTTVVIGGTGDFEGFTGRVITSIDNPDESGQDPIFTGRMTFQLVVPRSG